jgi:coenzyme PQQ synthesis protein D (PqqD)
MSGFSGSERFGAVNGLEVTRVPDGFVIYDEPRNMVHYLNSTAAVVYAVCDGKKTVAEISEFLRDVYEIDEVPKLEELFANFERSGLVCRTK